MIVIECAWVEEALRRLLDMGIGAGIFWAVSFIVDIFRGIRRSE